MGMFVFCRSLIHAVATFRVSSTRHLGRERRRAPGVDVVDFYIGTGREILVFDCLQGYC